MEALKRSQTPVYVKGLRELPSGNRKLIECGAQESPGEPWVDLRELFAKSSLPNATSVDERTVPQSSEIGGVSHTEPTASDSPTFASGPGRSDPAEHANQAPSDAYHHISEVMLDLLAEPMDAKALSHKMNVSLTQVNAWLKRSIKEGRVRKTKPGSRYVKGAAVRAVTTLSLFAPEGEASIKS